MKKLTALLLCVALLLSFTACGRNTKDGAANTQPPVTNAGTSINGDDANKRAQDAIDAAAAAMKAGESAASFIESLSTEVLTGQGLDPAMYITATDMLLAVDYAAPDNDSKNFYLFIVTEVFKRCYEEGSFSDKAQCDEYAAAFFRSMREKGYSLDGHDDSVIIYYTVDGTNYSAIIEDIFQWDDVAKIIADAAAPEHTPPIYGTLDDPIGHIASAHGAILVLFTDGTIGYYDDINGAPTKPASEWTGIKYIAAESDDAYGITTDGHVLYAGSDIRGQSAATQWEGIVSIKCSQNHVVGLREDGTVVAAGYEVYGACDVDGWTDIVMIAVGANHTLGLKSDGTVVATGRSYSGECDVSAWSDIVSIEGGYEGSYGVKSDGSVITTGKFTDDEIQGIAAWSGKRVKQICRRGDITRSVALFEDGTLEAAGAYWENTTEDLSNWKNVTAIEASQNYIMGICEDGTVYVSFQTSDSTWNKDGINVFDRSSFD